MTRVLKAGIALRDVKTVPHSNSHGVFCMQLENRVAVITGAASGIGKEIARTFAQAGATVVIADRNVAAAQEAAKELGSSGPRTLAVAMDVTSESDVESGIADVIA